MNTTETNLQINAPFFAANNTAANEPLLAQLRETYLDAGLPPGNALQAAIADYTQFFTNAA